MRDPRLDAKREASGLNPSSPAPRPRDTDPALEPGPERATDGR